MYPFSYEMQWGEWLRTDLEQGLAIEARKDPNITILLKKVQLHHQDSFWETARSLSARYFRADG